MNPGEAGQAPSPTPDRRGGTPVGGRAARRRAARRAPRTGAWLTGAIGFAVAAVAVGSFFALRGHDGAAGAMHSPSAASYAPAARCTATAPTPTPTAVSTADAGPVLRPGPTAAPLDVRVTVLNGSGTFGQAENVLNWMQNHQGYLRTSNGGPAPRTARTSLVYAPNHADQARALAAALHLPASALHGTGRGTGARDPMVLTLGQDFQGVGRPLQAPSPSSPTRC